MAQISGKKVRELRQKAKIPSLKLAEGICSDLMLFQIEKDFAQPSLELASKIAERLGVPVADLQVESA